jgi:spermidine/putrescine transport system ATP-binding protein
MAHWPHQTECTVQQAPEAAANHARVAVRVDQVTMVYGGKHSHKALDNVSLDIFENEFFTLLGPSGCGKTTLLRLIAGFEQPTEGELQLDGASLVGKLPFERPVNTVFQSYALFPHMTVAQNIAFGLEMQQKPASAIKATVAQMLTLVRLSELGGRKPAQLSGGQQQRVALARALATHPRVLLLDESLSALDLQLRKEMQIELKRLQRETGITFVFVTHDQEEALTMSDRIAVMHAGKVQQIGSPMEIYDRPTNRFVAGFIGETNLLRASVHEGNLNYGAAGQTALPDVTWLGDVTLAVRPERLHLVPPDMVAAVQGQGIGVLQGTVQNVVYMGHDTTYTVQLPEQALCKVRTQNTQGATQVFAVGDMVGVRVDTEALRRLAD